MGYVTILILIVMGDVDVLRNKLKLKVSKDFLQMICDLKRGKNVNLEYVLEAISAIEFFDQPNILQFYLNHE